MRRLGYRAVDLLVDRWTGLGDEPPLRVAPRAELEPLLREPAPEHGRPPDRVLERAAREVLPLAGRLDHPRFFAFIPSSPTWPSVLGNLLATGHNVFQGTWLESAGPSQVELVVLDWFREMTGLPAGAGGLFTSGGSTATLVALVTAREGAEADPGAGAPVVYVSEEGHSSVDRAARIAGLGASAVRRLPTDDRFRLRPETLTRALAEDRERGRAPLFACANAGATSTGAVDPLGELADVCREAGVWYHVDAAYGGFAALTERGRRALAGMEGADSVTLDPHKWLFQPYEAGCLLVRDTALLERAFGVLPEYLQDVALGAGQVNFADRGVQLTRRFRALDVWMTVQTFGLAALRRSVDGALDLATEAAAWIGRSQWLELLAPPSLGVVCFRCRPPGTLDEPRLEALNAEVQARIVGEGTAMMASTRLRGRYALRLCILGWRTTWDDVRVTLERAATLTAEAADG